MTKETCAKAPCGSCPYRRHVPSGVWQQHEYDKLPAYDAPTGEQPPNLFMCHQADGKLCAGWVGCHGMELLALRLCAAFGRLDPKVVDYQSPVPLFASGAGARAHGMADIDEPGDDACRMMAGLERKRAAS